MSNRKPDRPGLKRKEVEFASPLGRFRIHVLHGRERLLDEFNIGEGLDCAGASLVFQSFPSLVCRK